MSECGRDVSDIVGEFKVKVLVQCWMTVSKESVQYLQLSFSDSANNESRKGFDVK